MEDGKINAMGMELKLTEVLGAELVEKYVAQLQPEVLKTLFEEVTNYYFYTSTHSDKVELKKTTYNGYRDESTELWKLIRNKVTEKFCGEIEDKINEIIASQEYRDKVDRLAEDIVEYATEQYKQDMLDRIRERLVGNTINATPAYNGQSFTEAVANVVKQMVPVTNQYPCY